MFIHPYAGVLSAYGMGLADQTVMREQAVELHLTAARDARPATPWPTGWRPRRWGRCARRAPICRALAVVRRLHVRYAGTEAALPVALGPVEAVTAAFTAAHRARFGFATPGRALVVEAVAVEATAAGETVVEATHRRPRRRRARAGRHGARSGAAARAHAAPVFERTALLAGDVIAGPALIREANATTVVEPGWRAEVTARDHMLLRRTAPRAAARRGGRPTGPTRCCWNCSTTCS